MLMVIIRVIWLYPSPLSLRVIILVQVFSGAWLGFCLGLDLWCVLIFLLIFFGGVIVLFVYVRSVAQNDTFSIGLSRAWLVPSLVALWVISSPSLAPLKLTSASVGRELFASTSFFWGLSAISYLLIVLVIAVKLTQSFYGALRVEYKGKLIKAIRFIP